MKIGIPRALLYHRYSVLWETFFKNLGHEVILSPKTNKAILEIGERLSVDENCLSTKLFFGHVKFLFGLCDCIFVPRISSYGYGKSMCRRFDALYDMCTNLFRNENGKFITCNVDIMYGHPEEKAYVNLGIELGADKKQSKKAYLEALKAQKNNTRKLIKEQDVLLEDNDHIKLLVTGHSYNVNDEYIGLPVIKQINSLGAIPIMADIIDSDESFNLCQKQFKNIPWLPNAELLGGIEKYHNNIDGIVLITAFPCGPDSIVNEMVIRKIKDKPILNIILDSQNGNAGIETRLESFIDIIRFRKIGSYNEQQ